MQPHPHKPHAKSGSSYEGFMLVLLIYFLLIAIPLSIAFLVTLVVAGKRTRAWRKEQFKSSASRHQQGSLSSSSAETQSLVVHNDSDDSELDPTDSGDEAELRLREEKRREATMTTRTYFWAQVRRQWKPSQHRQNELKAKERSDRIRLAKVVAKEVLKLERKKDGTRGAERVEGLEKRKI